MTRMLFTALLALAGCDQVVEASASPQDRCNIHKDIEACFQIGKSALDASIPNNTKARTFLSKACTFHHAEGCNLLATMVNTAKGGPRDPKRAAELFDIACKGGVPTACVELGLMLFDGDGVDKDAMRAVGIFQTSCGGEPPQPKACTALGRAYAEGVGIDGEADLEIAERMHRKACTSDDAPGCVEVGALLRAKTSTNAEETAANQTGAMEFFHTACRLDPAMGCFELAAMHRDKELPDPSDSKASILFQKACQADPTRGCFEAAELMVSSPRLSAKANEIESLYNLACEHGHTEACSKRSVRRDEP
ncbi:MAG: TPR repeat protein [Myxococcota bacterium]|jgi:TPR repeat protein